jgi:hypothetical protein
MAHYAELDENNIVVNVFVGRDEGDLADGVTSWEEYYARPGFTVKRTSYNGNIRGVYAGIGYTYDEVNDVFVAPIEEISDGA